MAGPEFTRIVLAFYSAGDDQASRAVSALPRSASRVWIADGGIRRNGASQAHFAALRLENEVLVGVESGAGTTESVVHSLRQTGTPTLFVLNPNGITHGLDEIEWQKPPSLTRNAIYARLRECKQRLDAARSGLIEATRLEHALTRSAEWILDNSYLIHTQLDEVQRHLPRDLTAQRDASAEDGGVCVLARTLASRTDFAINPDNIRSYLKELQKTRPLTTGELWLFPLFLRIALIERLTALAARVCESQQLRELASLWANRLIGSARISHESLDAMMQRLDAEPYARQPYFITALAEQLQDEEAVLGALQDWIQKSFESPLMDLARGQHANEAAQALSTANAFGSLRVLAQIEFTKIFEEVSLVEAVLRTDPGGIYARSDFETRDRCRRQIERISRCSVAGEIEVARRVTQLAAESTDPRNAHVAYYLLAEGVTQVEAETRARVGLRTRVQRSLNNHATAYYIPAVAGLTVCFAAITGALAWETGVRSYAVLGALTALALFPLSELSTQIVHALIISLLSPDPLAKMDWQDGIPKEHATLVVVPMMLTDTQSVGSEIEKLEVRYLANRDENVYYSLFSDFLDSAAEKDTADEEVLQKAIGGINDLNARYPGGRFLLFHRPRTWSKSEQRWIGRERKRGKIEDLNAFLCGESDGSILRAGSLSVPIAYVLTLDADTTLPLDTARRLVETIAHPLNRVQIDPVAKLRIRGYTVIQPRISIALPAATATRFTRVFADATGTDPYCQTVSDAQQDLFLEGIFHGKAIYDVKAFHTILKNRFPAEKVLSHDLIEGAYTGVGLASDIELFENLPLNYGIYAVRQHRWIRGDWQIAPWIFGRVTEARGRGKNPLTYISRWRILDNLRRSLVPVAALLLLLLGWLISAAPGVWSLVVGLAVAIPALAPLLDQLVRRLQGTVRGWHGATDDLERMVVMISFLPHQAWISVDAICRVLYRTRISRRNLLEWQTADRSRMLASRHMDAGWRAPATVHWREAIPPARGPPRHRPSGRPSDRACLSHPIAAMQRHDAAEEVVVATVFQTSGLHHAKQRVLIRMTPDGFGQVAVAIGISCDQLAQFRQHVEGIQVVQAAERRAHGLGKLQHQQLPAGLEHLRHGGQCCRLVGHISQSKTDSHTVKAVRRERQPLGVGLHVVDIADYTAIDQTLTAARQHGGVDIRDQHQTVAPDLFGQSHGQITGAAGDVKRPTAGLQSRQRQCEALPQAVRAAGHQIVHQVVAIGDRIEHRAHAPRFVAQGDLLKAEVGRAVFV